MMSSSFIAIITSRQATEPPPARRAGGITKNGEKMQFKIMKALDIQAPDFCEQLFEAEKTGEDIDADIVDAEGYLRNEKGGRFLIEGSPLHILDERVSLKGMDEDAAAIRHVWLVRQENEALAQRLSLRRHTTGFSYDLMSEDDPEDEEKTYLFSIVIYDKNNVEVDDIEGQAHSFDATFLIWLRLHGYLLLKTRPDGTEIEPSIPGYALPLIEMVGERYSVTAMIRHRLECLRHFSPESRHEYMWDEEDMIKGTEIYPEYRDRVSDFAVDKTYHFVIHGGADDTVDLCEVKDCPGCKPQGPQHDEVPS